jgi:hypothetical protein
MKDVIYSLKRATQARVLVGLVPSASNNPSGTPTRQSKGTLHPTNLLLLEKALLDLLYWTI